MLAENLGGFDQGHFGAQRAVGPNFERQLVVVGLLADAGFLNLVTHAGHGAVDGVDRNDADFLHVRAVLGGRHVAAAIFDDHFHDEGHVVGQRDQHVMLVDHVNRFVGLDIGPRDHALLMLFDPDDLCRLAVVLDDQRL